MDVDDDLMGFKISPTGDDASSSKASEGTPAVAKNKKATPSENKSKPKGKKGNSGKSWSANAIGGGSNQVDASAFSFHRMRTLMKTQAAVQNITHDATFLVAKATEMFIRDLAYRMAEEALASNGMNGSRQNGSSEHGLVVNYDHLADIVQSNKRLVFLKDFVPHKVVAGQVFPELAINNSNKLSDDNVIDLVSDSS